jgi:hypothetical protein
MAIGRAHRRACCGCTYGKLAFFQSSATFLDRSPALRDFPARGAVGLN